MGGAGKAGWGYQDGKAGVGSNGQVVAARIAVQGKHVNFERTEAKLGPGVAAAPGRGGGRNA